LTIFPLHLPPACLAYASEVPFLLLQGKQGSFTIPTIDASSI
jgi:hypothetical protein